MMTITKGSLAVGHLVLAGAGLAAVSDFKLQLFWLNSTIQLDHYSLDK